MKKQGLTKWLKAGYPQFKEYSGVPAWLLPGRSSAGEDYILHPAGTRLPCLTAIFRSENGIG